jgi:NitT/TauT family transport system substrate-binding protein
MRLRLYENYRFLLYAPFYAAHAIGAYDAEGIAVELLPSPGPGRAEAALLAGAAEIMWAGPMRIIKTHDDDPQSPLVCFAEVVCRDPFSLIGREKRPDFHLADLAGIKFASVAEVPTPWLCLQEDLRQAGIDPDRLDRVADRGMADNLAALRAPTPRDHGSRGVGEIAAAQFFEPFVEEALATGAGHLWHQASRRGRTSYTAFVTTRARLLAEPEPLLRLVRAIHRTQHWIAGRAPGEIAAAVAPFFPALDRGVMTRALARYAGQGVWGRDPVLPQEGFERLRAGLLSSGFVRRPVAFAECVDNRLAAQVTAGQ